MNWIVLAAHRNHSCWSLQTLANRLGDGCLAYTRRTCQKQHHTLLRIDALVLGNELQNSLLCLNHSIVATLKHVLREVYVPERILSLVPWQPENIVEECDFARSLHVVFVLQAIDLFLDHLSC